MRAKCPLKPCVFIYKSVIYELLVFTLKSLEVSRKRKENIVLNHVSALTKAMIGGLFTIEKSAELKCD